MNNLSNRCAGIVMLCFFSALVSAQDHNIGYYQKIHGDGQNTTWRLLWSGLFPEAADEQVLPGDMVVPWGGVDDGGLCSDGSLPGNELCLRGLAKSPSAQSGEDDPVELPDIVVTASPPSRPSYMLAILPYRGSGGGCREGGDLRCAGSIPVGDAILRPPSVVKECDPADEEIDKTADLREYLMDQSLSEDDLPMEYGGLFWPDGEGGYQLLEYGVDILGGGSGPCGIDPPRAPAFPPAEQWPSGVIFFHTHPYIPGEFSSPCGLTVDAGPSDADRDHLGWLRHMFNSDVEGMVMDKMAIYRYGTEVDEDQAPTQRCE